MYHIWKGSFPNSRGQMIRPQTVLPKLHSGLSWSDDLPWSCSPKIAFFDLHNHDYATILPKFCLGSTHPCLCVSDIRCYSWRGTDKHLLTPERKLTTDISTDTTNVSFDQPMSLIWVADRDIGEVLKDLYWLKAGTSPKLTPLFRESGNLEHTVQFARSSTGWSVSFSNGSVGLSLFWTAQLVLLFLGSLTGLRIF